MNFHRFGLYIVTLSERHFRFPKSQVFHCITQHFEKRKSRYENIVKHKANGIENREESKTSKRLGII